MEERTHSETSFIEDGSKRNIYMHVYYCDSLPVPRRGHQRKDKDARLDEINGRYQHKGADEVNVEECWERRGKPLSE